MRGVNVNSNTRREVRPAPGPRRGEVSLRNAGGASVKPPAFWRWRTRPAGVPRGEEGFVLVETLAAFAILVMVLAALFVAVSGAIRANARAAFVLTAIRLGQSRLAQTAVALPLLPGETAGRFGNGYVWRQRVSGYQGEAHGAPALFWVELTIKAGEDVRAGGSEFVMVTLRPGAGVP